MHRQTVANSVIGVVLYWPATPAKTAGVAMNDATTKGTARTLIIMGVPGLEETAMMIMTVHLVSAMQRAAVKLSMVTTVGVSVLSALFVSWRRPDEGGKCTTVRSEVLNQLLQFLSFLS